MAFDIRKDPQQTEVFVQKLPNEPFFSKTYKTTANILAGARSNQVFVPENEQWEAAPFDSMLITNRDVVDLDIELDGNPDNTITCKAGFQISATDQKFRTWAVVNLDAVNTHTAGKLSVLVQNTIIKRRL